MDRGATGDAARDVDRLFRHGNAAGLTDGQLLERFRRDRDAVAFEAILTRHGPRVLAVCRRVLGRPDDADDAFQATFLLLVRQSGSIRDVEALGGWLVRVADRVARVARTAAARRARHESRRAAERKAVVDDRADERAALREELDQLPEQYRTPLVLCDLEGHTYEEAAERLSWSSGTLRGRLARARTLLRSRLLRRGWAGVVGAAVAGSGAEGAAVSSALREVTLRLAMGEAPSVAVSRLMKAALWSMLVTKWAWISGLLVMAGGVATGTYLMAGGPGVGPQSEGKAPAVGAVRNRDQQRGGSPLDRLDPASIPAEERIDGQPNGLVAVLGEHRGRNWGMLNGMALSPDGKIVVTAGLDGRVRLWDAETLRERAALPLREGDAFMASFQVQTTLAVSGRRLAIGGHDGIRILELAADGTKATEVAVIREDRDLPRDTCPRFAPTGTVLFSYNRISGLRAWDLAGDKPLGRNPLEIPDLVGDKPVGRTVLEIPNLTSFAVSPDGKLLATALAIDPFSEMRRSGVDEPEAPPSVVEVKLWHLEGTTVQPLADLKAPLLSVDELEFSPRSDLLASYGMSGIRVWDLTGEKPTIRANLPEQDAGNNVTVHSVTFSPDEKSLAVARVGGAELWDIAARPARRRAFLSASSNGTNSDIGTAGVSFSRDGHQLLVGDMVGLLRSWDISGPEPKLRPIGRGHVGVVDSLMFLPDGKTLISTGIADGTLRSWDLTRPDSDPLATMDVAEEGSISGRNAMVVTPDGKSLATAGEHGDVILWDLSGKASKRRATLKGHNLPDYRFGNVISGLILGSDGRSLLTSGVDGLLILWDLETAKELRRWSVPGSIHALALAPDGRHVATGNSNGTIYLIRIDDRAVGQPRIP